MASVHFSEIRKSFGPVQVLNGVTVDIHDGEFVALVGPSGCGKSTLLRMLAGLDAPDSGSIRIGQQLVNGLGPGERDIAMVFQNYGLYPNMTVRQNMAFPLRMRRLSNDQVERQVTRAAEILNLAHLLDRRPRQLSGGQRQRVAMGRAIVRDPKVFLFDEPLSNLDAKLRVSMRAEIKALHQRLATTTLYVTHDQIEAMTMADRIVVMHEGRIAQMGSPLELYDRPQNVMVAGFIGSPAMNFIPGRCGARGFTADSGLQFDYPLPASLSGPQVVAGVRPEHFVPADDGIPFEVVVNEPTGLQTEVVARAHGQEFVFHFSSRMDNRPGDVLRLKPLPHHVHYFGADSGQRIHTEG